MAPRPARSAGATARRRAARGAAAPAPGSRGLGLAAPSPAPGGLRRLPASGPPRAALGAGADRRDRRREPATPRTVAVAAHLARDARRSGRRVAAGVPAFAVRASARGVESVGVGDLVVPTEADGSVWIHYSPHDPSRFVSAADVLAGRVAPHQFERKLVLIGVTAVGLSDHQATPVADRMPGVEIHAQLLEDIFDGSLLARPRWVGRTEAALLAAGGLLLILAVPRF